MPVRLMQINLIFKWKHLALRLVHLQTEIKANQNWFLSLSHFFVSQLLAVFIRSHFDKDDFRLNIAQWSVDLVYCTWTERSFCPSLKGHIIISKMRCEITCTRVPNRVAVLAESLCRREISRDFTHFVELQISRDLTHFVESQISWDFMHFVEPRRQ